MVAEIRSTRCERRVRSVLALCLTSLALFCAAFAPQARAANDLHADIPRQPLAPALATFAQLTGLQLVYQSEIARGKLSPGAPAGLEPHVALTRLLEGTALNYEFLNERTVRIYATVSYLESPLTRARSPKPETSTYTGATLEEVVVTATAREESLDRVPATIVVWTRKKLESTGVAALEDLASQSPGVYIYQTSELGAGIRANIVMRGLTSDIHSTSSDVYLDEVPLRIRNSGASAFGAFNLATFDIDRVEILYGPQGTLGGDAAEGGTIRYFTTQPSLTDWSGYVRVMGAATVGGTPSNEIGAAIGGPLEPEYVGFRVSVWARDDGGYVDRVDPFTGATVDSESNKLQTTSVHGALTIAPTNSLRITPSVTYQKSSLYDSPIFYESFSAPEDGILRNGKLLRQPANDQFLISALSADWDFQGMALSSYTAYTRRTAATVLDGTNNIGSNYGGWGNPLGPEYPISYLDAVPIYIDTSQGSLSEELRLASSDTRARLRWLAGVWLAHATEDETDVTAPIDPDVAVTLAGSTRSKVINDQVDFFGQLDVLVVPKWRASAGVRVSHDQVEEEGYASGPVNAGSPAYVSGKLTSAPLAPRLALTYTPKDYGAYYLSVAKGYRLGGLNLPQSTICSPPFPYPASYGPDSVWNYELGAKTRTQSGTLSFEGALFHMVWHDIQQLGISNACEQQYVLNASTAASDGVDFSTTVAASATVHLGATLEYVNARYTRTVHYGGGFVVHAGDALGLAPYVAPPWSGTIWFDGDVLRTDRWTTNVRVDGQYHSHNPGPFYTQDPADRQYAPNWYSDPATSLMNCRVRVSWRAFDVTAFVDNVFDAQPVLSRKSDTRRSTIFYASTFRPRTVGLAVTMRF